MSDSIDVLKRVRRLAARRLKQSPNRKGAAMFKAAHINAALALRELNRKHDTRRMRPASAAIYSSAALHAFYHGESSEGRPIPTWLIREQ